MTDTMATTPTEPANFLEWVQERPIRGLIGFLTSFAPITAGLTLGTTTSLFVGVGASLGLGLSQAFAVRMGVRQAFGAIALATVSGALAFGSVAQKVARQDEQAAAARQTHLQANKEAYGDLAILKQTDTIYTRPTTGRSICQSMPASELIEMPDGKKYAPAVTDSTSTGAQGGKRVLIAC